MTLAAVASAGGKVGTVVTIPLTRGPKYWAHSTREYDPRCGTSVSVTYLAELVSAVEIPDNSVWKVRVVSEINHQGQARLYNVERIERG
jgi:hypothetical protein